MWKHFDTLIGMSFLPHSGGSYKQAPYEEIGLAEYNRTFDVRRSHRLEQVA